MPDLIAEERNMPGFSFYRFKRPSDNAVIYNYFILTLKSPDGTLHQFEFLANLPDGIMKAAHASGKNPEALAADMESAAVRAFVGALLNLRGKKFSDGDGILAEIASVYKEEIERGGIPLQGRLFDAESGKAGIPYKIVFQENDAAGLPDEESPERPSDGTAGIPAGTRLGLGEVRWNLKDVEAEGKNPLLESLRGIGDSEIEQKNWENLTDCALAAAILGDDNLYRYFLAKLEPLMKEDLEKFPDDREGWIYRLIVAVAIAEGREGTFPEVLAGAIEEAEGFGAVMLSSVDTSFSGLVLGAAIADDTEGFQRGMAHVMERVHGSVSARPEWTVRDIADRGRALLGVAVREGDSRDYRQLVLADIDLVKAFYGENRGRGESEIFDGLALAFGDFLLAIGIAEGYSENFQQVLEWLDAITIQDRQKNALAQAKALLAMEMTGNRKAFKGRIPVAEEAIRSASDAGINHEGVLAEAYGLLAKALARRSGAKSPERSSAGNVKGAERGDLERIQGEFAEFEKMNAMSANWDEAIATGGMQGDEVIPPQGVVYGMGFKRARDDYSTRLSSLAIYYVEKQAFQLSIADENEGLFHVLRWIPGESVELVQYEHESGGIRSVAKKEGADELFDVRVRAEDGKRIVYVLVSDEIYAALPGSDRDRVLESALRLPDGSFAPVQVRVVSETMANSSLSKYGMFERVPAVESLSRKLKAFGGIDSFFEFISQSRAITQDRGSTLDGFLQEYTVIPLDKDHANLALDAQNLCLESKGGFGWALNQDGSDFTVRLVCADEEGKALMPELIKGFAQIGLEYVPMTGPDGKKVFHLRINVEVTNDVLDRLRLNYNKLDISDKPSFEEWLQPYESSEGHRIELRIGVRGEEYGMGGRKIKSVTISPDGWKVKARSFKDIFEGLATGGIFRKPDEGDWGEAIYLNPALKGEAGHKRGSYATLMEPLDSGYEVEFFLTGEKENLDGVDRPFGNFHLVYDSRKEDGSICVRGPNMRPPNYHFLSTFSRKFGDGEVLDIRVRNEDGVVTYYVLVPDGTIEKTLESCHDFRLESDIPQRIILVSASQATADTPKYDMFNYEHVDTGEIVQGRDGIEPAAESETPEDAGAGDGGANTAEIQRGTMGLVRTPKERFERILTRLNEDAGFTEKKLSFEGGRQYELLPGVYSANWNFPKGSYTSSFDQNGQTTYTVFIMGEREDVFPLTRAYPLGNYSLQYDESKGIASFTFRRPGAGQAETSYEFPPDGVDLVPAEENGVKTYYILVPDDVKTKMKWEAVDEYCDFTFGERWTAIPQRVVMIGEREALEDPERYRGIFNLDEIREHLARKEEAVPDGKVRFTQVKEIARVIKARRGTLRDELDFSDDLEGGPHFDLNFEVGREWYQLEIVMDKSSGKVLMSFLDFRDVSKWLARVEVEPEEFLSWDIPSNPEAPLDVTFRFKSLPEELLAAFRERGVDFGNLELIESAGGDLKFKNVTVHIEVEEEGASLGKDREAYLVSRETQIKEREALSVNREEQDGLGLRDTVVGETKSIGLERSAETRGVSAASLGALDPRSEEPALIADERNMPGFSFYRFKRPSDNAALYNYFILTFKDPDGTVHRFEFLANLPEGICRVAHITGEIPDDESIFPPPVETRSFMGPLFDFTGKEIGGARGILLKIAPAYREAIERAGIPLRGNLYDKTTEGNKGIPYEIEFPDVQTPDITEPKDTPGGGHPAASGSRIGPGALVNWTLKGVAIDGKDELIAAIREAGNRDAAAEVPEEKESGKWFEMADYVLAAAVSGDYKLYRHFRDILTGQLSKDMKRSLPREIIPRLWLSEFLLATTLAEGKGPEYGKILEKASAEDEFLERTLSTFQDSVAGTVLLAAVLAEDEESYEKGQGYISSVLGSSSGGYILHLIRGISRSLLGVALREGTGGNYEALKAKAFEYVPDFMGATSDADQNSLLLALGDLLLAIAVAEGKNESFDTVVEWIDVQRKASFPKPSVDAVARSHAGVLFAAAMAGDRDTFNAIAPEAEFLLGEAQRRAGWTHHSVLAMAWFLLAKTKRAEADRRYAQTVGEVKGSAMEDLDRIRGEFSDFEELRCLDADWAESIAYSAMKGDEGVTPGGIAHGIGFKRAKGPYALRVASLMIDYCRRNRIQVLIPDEDEEIFHIFKWIPGESIELVKLVQASGETPVLAKVESPDAVFDVRVRAEEGKRVIYVLVPDSIYEAVPAEDRNREIEVPLKLPDGSFSPVQFCVVSESMANAEPAQYDMFERKGGAREIQEGSAEEGGKQEKQGLSEEGRTFSGFDEFFNFLGETHEVVRPTDPALSDLGFAHIPIQLNGEEAKLTSENNSIQFEGDQVRGWGVKQTEEGLQLGLVYWGMSRGERVLIQSRKMMIPDFKLRIEYKPVRTIDEAGIFDVKVCVEVSREQMENILEYYGSLDIPNKPPFDQWFLPYESPEGYRVQLRFESPDGTESAGSLTDIWTQRLESIEEIQAYKESHPQLFTDSGMTFGSESFPVPPNKANIGFRLKGPGVNFQLDFLFDIWPEPLTRSSEITVRLSEIHAAGGSTVREFGYIPMSHFLSLDVPTQTSMPAGFCLRFFSLPSEVESALKSYGIDLARLELLKRSDSSPSGSMASVVIGNEEEQGLPGMPEEITPEDQGGSSMLPGNSKVATGGISGNAVLLGTFKDAFAFFSDESNGYEKHEAANGVTYFTEKGSQRMRYEYDLRDGKGIFHFDDDHAGLFVIGMKEKYERRTVTLSFMPEGANADEVIADLDVTVYFDSCSVSRNENGRLHFSFRFKYLPEIFETALREAGTDIDSLSFSNGDTASIDVEHGEVRAASPGTGRMVGPSTLRLRNIHDIEDYMFERETDREGGRSYVTFQGDSVRGEGLDGWQRLSDGNVVLSLFPYKGNGYANFWFRVKTDDGIVEIGAHQLSGYTGLPVYVVVRKKGGETLANEIVFDADKNFLSLDVPVDLDVPMRYGVKLQDLPWQILSAIEKAGVDISNMELVDKDGNPTGETASIETEDRRQQTEDKKLETSNEQPATGAGVMTEDPLTKIRRAILGMVPDAQITQINLSEDEKGPLVTVWTRKPGIVIGRQGKTAETIVGVIKEILGNEATHWHIEEIRDDSDEAVAPEIQAILESGTENTSAAGRDGGEGVGRSGRLADGTDKMVPPLDYSALKILILDSPDTIEPMSELLRRDGLENIESATSLDEIQVILDSGRNDFDLIFVDPQQSSEEVAEAIRRLRAMNPDAYMALNSVYFRGDLPDGLGEDGWAMKPYSKGVTEQLRAFVHLAAAKKYLKGAGDYEGLMQFLDTTMFSLCDINMDMPNIRLNASGDICFKVEDEAVTFITVPFEVLKVADFAFDGDDGVLSVALEKSFFDRLADRLGSYGIDIESARFKFPGEPGKSERYLEFKKVEASSLGKEREAYLVSREAQDETRETESVKREEEQRDTFHDSRTTAIASSLGSLDPLKTPKSKERNFLDLKLRMHAVLADSQRDEGLRARGIAVDDRTHVAFEAGLAGLYNLARSTVKSILMPAADDPEYDGKKKAIEGNLSQRGQARLDPENPAYISRSAGFINEEGSLRLSGEISFYGELSPSGRLALEEMLNLPIENPEDWDRYSSDPETYDRRLVDFLFYFRQLGGKRVDFVTEKRTGADGKTVSVHHLRFEIPLGAEIEGSALQRLLDQESVQVKPDAPKYEEPVMPLIYDGSGAGEMLSREEYLARETRIEEAARDLGDGYFKFENGAAEYERILNLPEGFVRRDLETVVREHEKAVVVDVGTGKGNFMKGVCGIPGVIALGQSLVSFDNPSDGLEIRKGDFLQRTFERQSADRVFSVFSIAHSGDPFGFVSEIYRILKIGGVARITFDYPQNSLILGEDGGISPLALKAELLRIAGTDPGFRMTDEAEEWTIETDEFKARYRYPGDFGTLSQPEVKKRHMILELTRKGDGELEFLLQVEGVHYGHGKKSHGLQVFYRRLAKSSPVRDTVFASSLGFLDPRNGEPDLVAEERNMPGFGFYRFRRPSDNTVIYNYFIMIFRTPDGLSHRFEFLVNLPEGIVKTISGSGRNASDLEAVMASARRRSFVGRLFKIKGERFEGGPDGVRIEIDSVYREEIEGRKIPSEGTMFEPSMELEGIPYRIEYLGGRDESPGIREIAPENPPLPGVLTERKTLKLSTAAGIVAYMNSREDHRKMLGFEGPSPSGDPMDDEVETWYKGESRYPIVKYFPVSQRMEIWFYLKSEKGFYLLAIFPAAEESEAQMVFLSEAEGKKVVITRQSLHPADGAIDLEVPEDMSVPMRFDLFLDHLSPQMRKAIEDGGFDLANLIVVDSDGNPTGDTAAIKTEDQRLQTEDHRQQTEDKKLATSDEQLDTEGPKAPAVLAEDMREIKTLDELTEYLSEREDIYQRSEPLSGILEWTIEGKVRFRYLPDEKRGEFIFMVPVPDGAETGVKAIILMLQEEEGKLKLFGNYSRTYAPGSFDLSANFVSLKVPATRDRPPHFQFNFTELSQEFFSEIEEDGIDFLNIPLVNGSDLAPTGDTASIKTTDNRPQTEDKKLATSDAKFKVGSLAPENRAKVLLERLTAGDMQGKWEPVELTEKMKEGLLRLNESGLFGKTYWPGLTAENLAGRIRVLHARGNLARVELVVIDTESNTIAGVHFDRSNVGENEYTGGAYFNDRPQSLENICAAWLEPETGSIYLHVEKSTIRLEISGFIPKNFHGFDYDYKAFDRKNLEVLWDERSSDNRSATEASADRPKTEDQEPEAEDQKPSGGGLAREEGGRSLAPENRAKVLLERLTAGDLQSKWEPVELTEKMKEGLLRLNNTNTTGEPYWPGLTMGNLADRIRVFHAREDLAREELIVIDTETDTIAGVHFARSNVGDNAYTGDAYFNDRPRALSALQRSPNEGLASQTDAPRLRGGALAPEVSPPAGVNNGDDFDGDGDERDNLLSGKPFMDLMAQMMTLTDAVQKRLEEALLREEGVWAWDREDSEPEMRGQAPVFARRYKLPRGSSFKAGYLVELFADGETRVGVSSVLASVADSDPRVTVSSTNGRFDVRIRRGDLYDIRSEIEGKGTAGEKHIFKLFLRSETIGEYERAFTRAAREAMSPEDYERWRKMVRSEFRRIVITGAAGDEIHLVFSDVLTPPDPVETGGGILSAAGGFLKKLWRRRGGDPEASSMGSHPLQTEDPSKAFFRHSAQPARASLRRPKTTDLDRRQQATDQRLQTKGQRRESNLLFSNPVFSILSAFLSLRDTSPEIRDTVFGASLGALDPRQSNPDLVGDERKVEGFGFYRFRAKTEKSFRYNYYILTFQASDGSVHEFEILADLPNGRMAALHLAGGAEISRRMFVGAVFEFIPDRTKTGPASFVIRINPSYRDEIEKVGIALEGTLFDREKNRAGIPYRIEFAEPGASSAVREESEPVPSPKDQAPDAGEGPKAALIQDRVEGRSFEEFFYDLTGTGRFKEYEQTEDLRQFLLIPPGSDDFFEESERWKKGSLANDQVKRGKRRYEILLVGEKEPTLAMGTPIGNVLLYYLPSTQKDTVHLYLRRPARQAEEDVYITQFSVREGVDLRLIDENGCKTFYLLLPDRIVEEIREKGLQDLLDFRIDQNDLVELFWSNVPQRVVIVSHSEADEDPQKFNMFERRGRIASGESPESPEPEEETPSPEPANPYADLKVLLTNRELPMEMILGPRLRESGVKTENITGAGEDSERWLDGGPYGVIVFAVMTEEDKQLVRELRTRNPRALIIAYTSHPNIGQEEMRGWGASVCLTLPVPRNTIMTLIDQYVREMKPAGEEGKTPATGVVTEGLVSDLPEIMKLFQAEGGFVPAASRRDDNEWGRLEKQDLGTIKLMDEFNLENKMLDLHSRFNFEGRTFALAIYAGNAGLGQGDGLVSLEESDGVILTGRGQLFFREFRGVRVITKDDGKKIFEFHWAGLAEGNDAVVENFKRGDPLAKSLILSGGTFNNGDEYRVVFDDEAEVREQLGLPEREDEVSGKEADGSGMADADYLRIRETLRDPELRAFFARHYAQLKKGLPDVRGNLGATRVAFRLPGFEPDLCGLSENKTIFFDLSWVGDDSVQFLGALGTFPVNAIRDIYYDEPTQTFHVVLNEDYYEDKEAEFLDAGKSMRNPIRLFSSGMPESLFADGDPRDSRFVQIESAATWVNPRGEDGGTAASAMEFNAEEPAETGFPEVSPAALTDYSYRGCRFPAIKRIDRLKPLRIIRDEKALRMPDDLFLIAPDTLVVCNRADAGIVIMKPGADGNWEIAQHIKPETDADGIKTIAGPVALVPLADDRFIVANENNNTLREFVLKDGLWVADRVTGNKEIKDMNSLREPHAIVLVGQGRILIGNRKYDNQDKPTLCELVLVDEKGDPAEYDNPNARWEPVEIVPAKFGGKAGILGVTQLIRMHKNRVMALGDIMGEFAKVAGTWKAGDPVNQNELLKFPVPRADFSPSPRSVMRIAGDRMLVCTGSNRGTGILELERPAGGDWTSLQLLEGEEMEVERENGKTKINALDYANCIVRTGTNRMMISNGSNLVEFEIEGEFDESYLVHGADALYDLNRSVSPGKSAVPELPFLRRTMQSLAKALASGGVWEWDKTDDSPVTLPESGDALAVRRFKTRDEKGDFEDRYAFSFFENGFMGVRFPAVELQMSYDVLDVRGIFSGGFADGISVFVRAGDVRGLSLETEDDGSERVTVRLDPEKFAEYRDAFERIRDGAENVSLRKAVRRSMEVSEGSIIFSGSHNDEIRLVFDGGKRDVPEDAGEGPFFSGGGDGNGEPGNRSLNVEDDPEWILWQRTLTERGQLSDLVRDFLKRFYPELVSAFSKFSFRRNDEFLFQHPSRTDFFDGGIRIEIGKKLLIPQNAGYEVGGRIEAWSDGTGACFLADIVDVYYDRETQTLHLAVNDRAYQRMIEGRRAAIDKSGGTRSAAFELDRLVFYAKEGDWPGTTEGKRPERAARYLKLENALHAVQRLHGFFQRTAKGHC
ncbi:MAG TPA: methyltransferase domain-containing protein, partial [Candidatus Omnitrophota bacterium]|nr:methyltransferase domain-containing protein [Candidatus Omnitrophota bacterium]